MQLFSKKTISNKALSLLFLLGLGLVFLVFSSCTGNHQGEKQVVLPADYPIQPVPFTHVVISGDFWKDRLETNRQVTIPIAFQESEKTGRIQNFEVAGGLKKGTFQGKYPFNDSDVYKIMEGAAYSLHVHKDPDLETYLEKIIHKVTSAQEDDGYLYTARTINPEKPVLWVEGERWSNMQFGHELYNMGHFYEAAAAHYMATGKRTLLNAAFKNADLLVSVFGPGKNEMYPVTRKSKSV